MKNENLFRTRRSARWLITLIALLTLCVVQVWADKNFWSENAWNFKYYNGGSDTYIGAQNMGATYDLGVQSTLYFKGTWVKTWWNDGWGTSNVTMYYGFGDNTLSVSNDDADDTWDADNKKQCYWEFGADYNMISNAPNSVGQNTMWVNWSIDSWRTSSTCYINFTIPGFSGAPANKSFGSNNVIGYDSETTISFTHYGNALAIGDCSITGTNASMFTVRDISESGVTVVFKPTSTGTKSATLTITDDHGKTCTIGLSGSGVALGSTTKLYFNDYTNNSDWIADGAKYRFSCQYTTGVYTNFPMTLCDNSTNTYSADVEIKTGIISIAIDRYNPTAPNKTWNSTSSLSLSASNPYAISNGKYSAYVANHPFNDVTGGKVYYDNSQSGFNSTKNYLVIGRDCRISDGNTTDKYSKTIALTNITNTKLSYATLSDTWHDATYYAFLAATSQPDDGTWGSSSLSSKASSSCYTAANKNLFGLLSGSTYLGSAPSKTGGTLTMTKNPTLSTTQTFNYALSTDGGTTYNPMNSGSPNTPGQLQLASYYFTNANCTTVNANSALTLSANATTYTTNKNNVAYTGTTTLTESDTRDGYTFVGWYEGSTLQTASAGTKSYTYYPRGNRTLTARYKAHRYTIAFDNNDTQYPSAPAATGTTTSISNVVYDQNVSLAENGYEREGYTFAGWNTERNGSGISYTDEQSVINLTAEDGATVTLYAQWTEDDLTFDNNSGSGDGDWNTASNWSPACVPTSGHDVTISAEVTVDEDDAVAKSVTIVSGGKLTIEPTGVLEVQGAITNDNSSRLVIETDDEHQGALIYDISQTAPHATVNLTTSKMDDDNFQYIASPVGYVSVNPTFAGKDSYTYAWIEGKGWEKRGYYEGFSGNEVIALGGQTSCTFSGQLYPITGGSLAYTATPSLATAQGVNMIPNTLTAPIKVKQLSITNGVEGAVHVWSNGAWVHYAPATGAAADQVIPALQGYAIIASASGSVSFDYDDAVRGASSKNEPLGAPKRIEADSPDYMTISVTTDDRKLDLLLSEHEQFSNGIDNGWEALYMEGDGRFGELYAQATEKMSILAAPNLEGTVLGFAPGQAESYTISFEGDGKGYYLNDVKMETSTLIEEGNTYEFAADESTNATRFVISKKPIHNTPTDVDAVNDGVKARKQLIDGVLYIIRDGRLYDVTGALVK